MEMPFKKAPSGEKRLEALDRLKKKQVGIRRQENSDVLQALTRVIRGMWQGDIDLMEVKDMDALQGLQVAVPESEAKDLELTGSFSFLERTMSLSAVLAD